MDLRPEAIEAFNRIKRMRLHNALVQTAISRQIRLDLTDCEMIIFLCELSLSALKETTDSFIKYIERNTQPSIIKPNQKEKQ